MRHCPCISVDMKRLLHKIAPIRWTRCFGGEIQEVKFCLKNFLEENKDGDSETLLTAFSDNYGTAGDLSTPEYGTLLLAAARIKDVPSIKKIIQHSKENSREIEGKDLRRVMETCLAVKDTAGIEGLVYELLRVDRAQIDIFLLNSCLKAMLETISETFEDRWRKARMGAEKLAEAVLRSNAVLKAVLELMDQVGIEPDSQTIGIIVSHYTLVLEPVFAFNLFAKYKEQLGLDPALGLFVVLHTAAAKRDLSMVQEFLEETDHLGITLTEEHYGFLLQAALENFDVPGFQKMWQASGLISLDPYQSSHLVSVACQTRSFDFVLELLGSPETFKPSQDDYSTVFHTLLRTAPQPPFWQEFHQSPFDYVEGFEQLQAFLDKMRAGKAPFNQLVKTALVTLCISYRAPDSFLSYFESLEFK